MRKEQVFDYYIVGDPADCLADKDLSLQAKGLFLTMLSDDETDVFTLRDLVAMSNRGKRTVISTIKELSDHGYLDIAKEGHDDI